MGKKAKRDGVFVYFVVYPDRVVGYNNLSEVGRGERVSRARVYGLLKAGYVVYLSGGRVLYRVWLPRTLARGGGIECTRRGKGVVKGELSYAVDENCDPGHDE